MITVAKKEASVITCGQNQYPIRSQWAAAWTSKYTGITEQLHNFCGRRQAYKVMKELH